MIGPALPLFMFQPPNWNSTKEIEKELMEEYLAKEEALKDAEYATNSDISDQKLEDDASVCNDQNANEGNDDAAVLDGMDKKDKKEDEGAVKPPVDAKPSTEKKDPLVEDPETRKKIPSFPKKPFNAKAEMFVPRKWVLFSVYITMLITQQTRGC